MPSGYAKRLSAHELVAALNEQKRSGADFPTLWRDVLRRHPLVAGIPIQVLIGSEPALKVELVTGQSLVMREGVFHLET